MKWYTPLQSKEGISKVDKIVDGQRQHLFKFFLKHPTQLLELVKVVSKHRRDNSDVSLPKYIDNLLRWEANWILSNLSSKFINKNLKVANPKKNKSYSPNTIGKTKSKPKTEIPYKLDYYEYIASPEWKKVSDLAKQRAGYRCQICNRHKSEVILHTHHRTYKNLGHEQESDLTVLCKDCHELFETSSKHRPSKKR